jgi:hypothetical protein
MIQGVYGQINELRGRVLTKEIEGITQAVANPEQQPGGARHVAAQLLGGLRATKQYDQDLIAYNARNLGKNFMVGTGGFNAEWGRRNPVTGFIVKEEALNPFAGETLTKDNMQDGFHYFTNKGEQVWNAKQNAFMSPNNYDPYRGIR